MKFGYLVVEGHHEIEFIGKILKANLSTKRITKLVDLPEFWHQIIPKVFPVMGDLLKRPPVPSFFQNDSISIAIHSAVGDTQLVNYLDNTLTVLGDSFCSIGVVADADGNLPIDRNKILVNELRKRTNLDFDYTPGNVISSKIKLGTYILPNNKSEGTLEKLLLQCAGINYSHVLEGATTFINSLDLSKFDVKDLKDFTSPAGKSKATIGCIGQVLRPGKAIQNSLQDNRWVDDSTLQLPDIAELSSFVTKLFG